MIIETKKLLKKCMSIDDYSYDIYFRMAVIEEYLKGNDQVWQYYNKMQYKRVSMIPHIPRNMLDHRKEFIELISSFQQNGFDMNCPILVNKDYLIIDGAHRMACALFFNIPNVSITTNKKYYNFVPREYTKKWFVDNSLMECIEYAEKQKAKIKR